MDGQDFIILGMISITMAMVQVGRQFEKRLGAYLTFIGGVVIFIYGMHLVGNS